jgi:hypothetical protein
LAGEKGWLFLSLTTFIGYFLNALSFDSLTVKERNGQLIGYLCVTLLETRC